MSSSLLENIDIVALSVSILICLAVLYRSLAVRRVLVSHTYRSRALWTGFVAVFIGAFGALQIITENFFPAYQLSGTLPVGVPLWLVFSFAILSVSGLLIIFIWIDSTIEVALDLDFMHRDAFRWKAIRRYVWVLVIITAIASGLTISAWEYLIVGIFVGILFTYLAVVLVVSGRRVRDSTMRSYMKWMGLLVAVLILEVSTSTVSFYLNFPLVIFAYVLYLAAGSLSKTSHIKVETFQGTSGVPGPSFGS